MSCTPAWKTFHWTGSQVNVAYCQTLKAFENKGWREEAEEKENIVSLNIQLIHGN